MEAIALKHAIQFHYTIGVILAAIILLNIGILLIKDFYKVHKYMWYMTPMIFGILSIMMISGFSILAMNHFHINTSIILMVIINIAIIVFEIIRIKKLRIVRKKPSLINRYKLQSGFLYTSYLIAVLLMLMLG